MGGTHVNAAFAFLLAQGENAVLYLIAQDSVTDHRTIAMIPAVAFLAAFWIAGFCLRRWLPRADWQNCFAEEAQEAGRLPLARCILSLGLAEDVQISMMDGIRQPYVMLEVRNLDESHRMDVEHAVQNELQRLADGGLDHEHLAAILANLEFQLRERDYGSMPQGIGLGMNVLDSWLYGGVNEPESCRTFLCVSFSALDDKLEAA